MVNAKKIIKTLISNYANSWEPFSRLFLLSDIPIWSISRDMEELSSICKSLKITNPYSKLATFCDNQCVFLGSHFDLLLNKNKWLDTKNRLATAYFHGKPGTGSEEFDICFNNLQRYHERISRIQVSYSGMYDVILDSGIDQEKVFLIPIAVNLNYFSFQTPQSRRQARDKLGVPQSAIVVGSFQKDSVGWGEGMEPKLVKGPDVLLDTLRILKSSVSNLFVLLSGPARGFVKAGLNQLGIPFLHVYQKSYKDVAQMFQLLDLYIVSSREEGGPKAVLESMASGVPLITTRVGQATDIVQHGINGWIVDPEDSEGLAYWCRYVVENRSDTEDVLLAGRKTAEANNYNAQLPLWKKFMDGFVDS